MKLNRWVIVLSLLFLVSLAGSIGPGPRAVQATRKVVARPPLQCDPPVTEFSWAVTGPVVTFSNATSGTIPMSFVWTFGDGDGTTQASPIHEYTIMGAYSVTLYALNSCGADNITKRVVVPMWPRAFLPLVVVSRGQE